MTQEPPKLPEDITDRLSDAYQIFEDGMTDVESTGLETAEDNLLKALRMYTTLYGEAQNVILHQQSSGGIVADTEHTNDLLHLIIARSALEMYKEMLKDPNINSTGDFKKIEDEALTPSNGVYNYERLKELGRILAYQNRIEDTQRIITDILYLE